MARLDMNRGKQQVLQNYLPGKTFDFEKISTIAQVEHIRGAQKADLNLGLILNSIEKTTSEWDNEFKPTFVDLKNGKDQFILIEPKAVESSMFPLVFWCQAPTCGHLFQSKNGIPNSDKCPTCNRHKLIQSRFVKIHRCGALEPLSAPYCNNTKCSGKHGMALDTRDGELVSEFRWICRSCNSSTGVFPGKCKHCNWQDPTGQNSNVKDMNITVHRAGRAYYPHSTVLLNQPDRELSSFMEVPYWQAVPAAMSLDLQQVRGKNLTDFFKLLQSSSTSLFSVSDDERKRMKESGIDEEAIAQFEKMAAHLKGIKEENNSPQELSKLIVSKSGLDWDVWERAGQELLESVTPLQHEGACQLSVNSKDQKEESLKKITALQELGISSVSLATDFPITLATYGFSRVDYQPNSCRLNSFPSHADYGGKFPIFVDVIQADAIVVQLNYELVLSWMKANGFTPPIPEGSDREISAKSYFIKLFDGISLNRTLPSSSPHARLVFGLLHTLCHFSLRRAALLCGLDATSLSEYLLPRTLSYAIYSNHRSGATIGALSALFEQSIVEWLSNIKSSRKCIYDPICYEGGGSCHACSHLAETSCRYFNLNLGRSFLYGGPDPVLGSIRTGFFDYIING